MSISTLKDWLLASTNTVVLTGAGMSTESGVPDFRSESGWWRNIDPRTVACVDALEHNYPLFREFYQMRIKALANCKPHAGHDILANWELRGLVALVATQNVDRFHQLAGSEQVEELHGNIQTVRCRECGKPGQLGGFLADACCTYCSGPLRPNVVLFGETLPERAWTNSLRAIQQADLVIVIGTSLEVYPVNQLPAMTRGKLVYINLDVAQHAHDFDLVIQGKVGDVLAEVDGLL
ncbi:NAD-dependent deacylase [Solibacillus sp. FSL H8-0538]|uniref:NAD-dependent deacylase n=1 Tax=Solibacillus sp. FSL H8-0538 TaxID=2921400 RepID=UPI0030FBF318